MLQFEAGCDREDRRARALVRDLVRRYGPDAVQRCLEGLPANDPDERCELLAERLAVTAGDIPPMPSSGRQAVEEADRRERDASRAAAEAWRRSPGASEKSKSYQALFRRFLCGEIDPESYAAELRRLAFEVPPLPTQAVRQRLEALFDAQPPIGRPAGPLTGALSVATERLGRQPVPDWGET
jgi:hypothetical protein